MLEDYRLIWRLRRGEKEALREIYTRYKDSVYTMALALVKDGAAAEDVLHDAFVKFANDAPNFSLFGSARNYLTRCAVRRSEEILQGKMYKVVEVDRKRAGPAEGSDSGQAALERERMEMVLEAMAKVPQPQREAVALHVHGGLDFRDIARVQQVSVNTAQSRYRYGIEKLASILEMQIDA